jgi:hypothetical protein
MLFRERSTAFPLYLDSFSSGFCTGPIGEFPREIRDFATGFATRSRN